MKLLTTAAMLSERGNSHVFRTRLLLDGNRLIIVGDGDPALADPDLLKTMRDKDGDPLDVETLLALWTTAIRNAGVEQIDEHWSILRNILLRQGIDVMESLPQKNVRRSEKRGLQQYFYNDALIEKALKLYGDDVSLFYNDTSIDKLIDNAPLPSITPLQSRSLKLSSWLRNHVFKR